MKNHKINVDAYKTIFEDLVAQDEPELALKLLDLVPAYFRDNKPQEFMLKKAELYSALLTAHSYLTSGYDDNLPESYNEARIKLLSILRGRAVQAEIDGFNGEPVQIIEVGAGEFLIPLGANGKFSYFDISLDKNTTNAVKNRIVRGVKPIPTIFVANEVIEHLSNPQELRWEMEKHSRGPVHYVHISTPMYCFDPNHYDWKEKGQPHLRAYTPNELMIECCKIWPEYRFELYSDGHIMSARGIHNGLVGIAKHLECDKLIAELEDLLKCQQFATM